MYYSSPIENSFYIVSIHLYLTLKGRAMADLADRHYALFANNQHPMQLEIYDDYNKMLRVAHSEDHQARIAATDDRIQEVMDQKTQLLNHSEGESLSTDDYQEIYCQVMAEEREKHNFQLNTRNKQGDISDFLETRRPFGAAQ